jgi:hypothetical protein
MAIVIAPLWCKNEALDMFNLSTVYAIVLHGAWLNLAQTLCVGGSRKHAISPSCCAQNGMLERRKAWETERERLTKEAMQLRRERDHYRAQFALLQDRRGPQGTDPATITLSGRVLEQTALLHSTANVAACNRRSCRRLMFFTISSVRLACCWREHHQMGRRCFRRAATLLPGALCGTCRSHLHLRVSYLQLLPESPGEPHVQTVCRRGL